MTAPRLDSRSRRRPRFRPLLGGVMNRMPFLAAAVVVLALTVGSPSRAQSDSCAGKADELQAAIDARGAKWVARRPRALTMTGLTLEAINAPRLPALIQAAAATLPKSIDWRDHGAVSGIRDQGACGSCWAFATTQALESQVMIAKPGAGDVRLSEQVLVSCSQGPATPHRGCDGGFLDRAADFLVSYGLPPESDYPYTATDGSCAKAKAGWQAHAFKIGGWNSVPAEIEAFKDALANYGPLPTVLNLRKDFKYYDSGIYSYVPGSQWGCAGQASDGRDNDDWGWHAVLIVGYNDEGRYFIVKNSWGPDWGEKGYFRIAYSELATKASFGKVTLVLLPRPGSRASAAGVAADASRPAGADADFTEVRASAEPGAAASAAAGGCTWQFPSCGKCDCKERCWVCNKDHGKAACGDSRPDCPKQKFLCNCCRGEHAPEVYWAEDCNDQALAAAHGCQPALRECPPLPLRDCSCCGVNDSFIHWKTQSQACADEWAGRGCRSKTKENGACIDLPRGASPSPEEIRSRDEDDMNKLEKEQQQEIDKRRSQGTL